MLRDVFFASILLAQDFFSRFRAGKFSSAAPTILMLPIAVGMPPVALLPLAIVVPPLVVLVAAIIVPPVTVLMPPVTPCHRRIVRCRRCAAYRPADSCSCHAACCRMATSASMAIRWNETLGLWKKITCVMFCSVVAGKIDVFSRPEKPEMSPAGEWCLRRSSKHD